MKFRYSSGLVKLKLLNVSLRNFSKISFTKKNARIEFGHNQPKINVLLTYVKLKTIFHKIGDSNFNEINYYLFTIAAVLCSDFTISKSEDTTLLATTTSAISRTIRLKFFILSRFDRFGVLTS